MISPATSTEWIKSCGCIDARAGIDRLSGRGLNVSGHGARRRSQGAAQRRRARLLAPRGDRRPCRRSGGQRRTLLLRPASASALTGTRPAVLSQQGRATKARRARRRRSSAGDHRPGVALAVVVRLAGDGAARRSPGATIATIADMRPTPRPPTRPPFTRRDHRDHRRPGARERQDALAMRLAKERVATGGPPYASRLRQLESGTVLAMSRERGPCRAHTRSRSQRSPRRLRPPQTGGGGPAPGGAREPAHALRCHRARVRVAAAEVRA